MSSDWTRPFEPDGHTVALYHFDEGSGNEAHDACGDPELTLRSSGRALWGSRPGFGSTARFERSDDQLRVGPANNDKLRLRTCTEEWTIEAWVRYTGPGGRDRGQWSKKDGTDSREGGYTYAFICGTDEEGFSLPRGMRGGWSFWLRNGVTPGTREDGLIPGVRYMGWVGRDPNHDTSSALGPTTSFGWLDEDRGRFGDTGWHHVAWQFRYRDQMNYLLVDGKLIRQVQLPAPGQVSHRIIVSDAERCDIPFCVGGVRHSRDPVVTSGLEMGNMDGEIDELRISKVMRYPVAERLAIIRQQLPDAALRIPYEVRLGAEAAAGRVSWAMTEGGLPAGLAFDADAGVIRGTPEETAESRRVSIGARDENGATDDHAFTLTVRRGRLVTESLPPAYAGSAYQAALTTERMAEPLAWDLVSGALPAGVSFDGASGCLSGTPVEAGRCRLTVQVTDANGLSDRRELLLRVLPEHLRVMGADEHAVVLYDWQGPDGRLFQDRVRGERTMTLTYTNIGGDRRLPWPGREGKFPQETGHGEHGYANIGKEWGSYPKARAAYESVPELDLKTCPREWTVEAWVRRGGPWQGFGDVPLKRFDYGHICGTYDSREHGVWELYLSDLNSPDAGMAPGVHFQSRNHAWKNLHPWMRPRGIVAEREEVGISDTEWHHVAWQYGYAEDEHELFLDGTPIWRMRNADGRTLVNDREHDCQFSVFTRLTDYAKYGGGFNYLGWGNFFGQIGEIRISSVRRY